MTVEQIIKAVRWCYDEEAQNLSNIQQAQAGDSTLMDNIIKAKIPDAVRWICLYAPTELLGGSDEQDFPTGILVDKTGSPTSISGTTGGKLTMPPDYIRLVRVRVNGWHRAVKNPISEDSDEYLQLRDENGATATADRPQAAIIDKATKEIEVWPTGASAEYTYVASLNDEDITKDGGTTVAIPPRAKTAFIYYLAFLVLSAYEDSRAARMLDIAKMNIGKNG